MDGLVWILVAALQAQVQHKPTVMIISSQGRSLLCQISQSTWHLFEQLKRRVLKDFEIFRNPLCVCLLFGDCQALYGLLLKVTALAGGGKCRSFCAWT